MLAWRALRAGIPVETRNSSDKNCGTIAPAWQYLVPGPPGSRLEVDHCFGALAECMRSQGFATIVLTTSAALRRASRTYGVFVSSVCFSCNSSEGIGQVALAHNLALLKQRLPPQSCDCLRRRRRGGQLPSWAATALVETMLCELTSLDQSGLPAEADGWGAWVDVALRSSTKALSSPAARAWVRPLVLDFCETCMQAMRGRTCPDFSGRLMCEVPTCTWKQARFM